MNKIRPPVLELVFEDFSRSPGVTLGHLKSSWNILTIFFDFSGSFLVIPENLKKIRPPVLELFFEDFFRSPGVTIGHLKSSWNILTIFLVFLGPF